jgi:hypothetical protein
MAARRERRSKTRRAVVEATSFRGMPSRRALLVLLVTGVVLAGVLLAVRTPDPNAPPLTASCTTPAAAVKTFGDAGTSHTYAITGPANATYIVTVDATTAVVRGSTADVTPPGAIAVSIRVGLKDCKGNGTLPPLSDGSHELVVFRDGERVATAKIG